MDVLQYRAFCDRVHDEVRKMVDNLRRAGVRVFMRFNTAGDSGERIVAAVSSALNTEDVSMGVGGDALVRIDDRCVFLSFLSSLIHRVNVY